MRSKICPYSFHSLHLLLVFVVLLVLLAPDAEAFVRRPNNGLMKLCPPGGQSFAAAWEITCGMRRRKREVLAPTTTTDNNDVEQQQSQQQMTNMTVSWDLPSGIYSDMGLW
uniref:Secreted protein n=1 Tax=Globodera pallida TaxID=36090 RepID=A0A183BMI4_GLOPA